MKLDVVKVANMIMTAINALTVEGQKSERLIEAKSAAMGEYDKMLAVSITELKAKDNPTTIVEKLAKGNVSDLLIKKIVAEESLKAHYSKLERLEAQLNGLQSINRYLESTTRND